LSGAHGGGDHATPYLAVDDADAAIECYEKAFGANERVRMEAPGGKAGHAELELADSPAMLSDPFPHCSTRPRSWLAWA
jgi:PhnB protein